LVDAHLARRPETAARIAAFRRFGGALLDAESPAQMTAGALDRALALIDRAAPAPAAAGESSATIDLDRLRWRWAGPGRRVARIEAPGATYKSFVMKIGPGLAMLDHGHAGAEWTVILDGAYEDAGGRHVAGDFIEEDEDTVHRPVADAREGCVCLIAMAGDLVAPGLAGRFARWALR
ncbi:MAG: cupin domain-containing protein, partial [Methylobacteriaceae bacterium]|nr:cupin domain-containing protein [Methylobacteriaceae bacterium]